MENTTVPTKTQPRATFSTTNHTWTPSIESGSMQCLAETDRLSNEQPSSTHQSSNFTVTYILIKRVHRTF